MVGGRILGYLKMLNFYDENEKKMHIIVDNGKCGLYNYNIP